MLSVELLVGCKNDITRISNGSARLERPISSQAYAAFGRARLLEAAGDTPGAISAYREVLTLDDDSDEALIRIGALSCATDPNRASDAFAQAERRNQQSAALFQAKARCALTHRKLDNATSAAEQALRLSPNDPEVSHLLIEVYLSAGRQQKALRYAWSHVALFPNDTNGWQTLADIVGPESALYSQIRRRAIERISAHVIYAVMPHSSQRTAAPAHLDANPAVRLDFTPAAQLDLDDALAAEDVHAIHRAARQLGLSTLELMDRAVQLGAFEFARSQAKLAGSILPDDARIWQLRLKLADLLRDDAEFEQLLEQLPTIRMNQSAIDWAELLTLVERRTGIRVVMPADAR